VARARSEEKKRKKDERTALRKAQRAEAQTTTDETNPPLEEKQSRRVDFCPSLGCRKSRQIRAVVATSVSVSGKRDFAGQRQRRRKGQSHSTARQQRQSAHTKTRQFGPTCTPPGNLCLRGTAWWRTQSQSNLSLRPISLLTGKLTGNFANSVLLAAYAC
jgi:hypothetical protein